MLLAVDSATRLMSIALYDGQALLAEQTWSSHNQHTRQLAPAIFTLLDSCDLELNDVSALGVSIGPGSYTGLRIGVALVKGIAAARKLPVVGMTTLDTLAAAQPHIQGGAGLVVVVQAGRARVIVKTYHWRKGQWGGRSEPLLLTWEGLLAQLDGPATITGEIDSDGMNILRAAQAAGTPLTIMPGAHRLRRAGFLAQAAWDTLHAAEDKSVYAAGRLLPIYLQTVDEPTPAVAPDALPVTEPAAAVPSADEPLS
ncbi:MAG: tRNA (adenosine(37)-N6)-threonylcarbamoyltransferase complex dimerization subunit type 1 TsaB [Armatimonadetes bacterium]|nr:tRNA (adenosine(37)-N6)-threonylcarbamoyltransferase complex dimerization subunit type 1 TsaB [Anaerolineae bacterium]